MASQMIGENSSLMQAEVNVPAMFEKLVFSSVYKIQRRRSAASDGTYKPPSSGIQSKTAFSKSTCKLGLRVLLNFKKLTSPQKKST